MFWNRLRPTTIDRFQYTKTPLLDEPRPYAASSPPMLLYKKSAPIHTVRPPRNDFLSQHSRNHSASHVPSPWWSNSVKKLEDLSMTTILDDPSESLVMDHTTSATKTCGGTHFVTTLSTLIMFLMAVVISFISNGFLLTSDDTQFYSNYYSGFFSVPKQPNHHIHLFESYHEPMLGNNATGGDRPKLVIHIGPHKTATTTTQAELTFFQDRLALDNYVYLGRLYYPFSNGERVVLNRTPDSLIQTYFRDMFQKCWKNTITECAEDLRNLLHSHFTTLDRPMPNLLISDEALLKLYDDPTDSKTNGNFIVLKDVLGRDFDITIVVTYRRFFEWLPSAKHQKDKPTSETSKTIWPGKARSGNSPKPLFPEDQTMKSTIEDWSREHFFTSKTYATLRTLLAPNFSVKVVHMYSKLSIRTNFLCNALPDAAHSCRASYREDAIHPETRINARSDEQDTDIPHYPGVFFDALATAAVAYIDTASWERQQVANMLRDHYYSASQAYFFEELRQAPMADADPIIVTHPKTAPTNPWKLPIVCPSRNRLLEFLHHSMSLEAQMLPKLFQKSSTQHVQDFWDAATRTMDFCWIDTPEVLSDARPWKQHIIDTFTAINPVAGI